MKSKIACFYYLTLITEPVHVENPIELLDVLQMAVIVNHLQIIVVIVSDARGILGLSVAFFLDFFAITVILFQLDHLDAASAEKRVKLSYAAPHPCSDCKHKSTIEGKEKVK